MISCQSPRLRPLLYWPSSEMQKNTLGRGLLQLVSIDTCKAHKSESHPHAWPEADVGYCARGRAVSDPASATGVISRRFPKSEAALTVRKSSRMTCDELHGGASSAGKHHLHNKVTPRPPQRCSQSTKCQLLLCSPSTSTAPGQR